MKSKEELKFKRNLSYKLIMLNIMLVITNNSKECPHADDTKLYFIMFELKFKIIFIILFIKIFFNINYY